MYIRASTDPIWAFEVRSVPGLCEHPDGRLIGLIAEKGFSGVPKIAYMGKLQYHYLVRGGENDLDKNKKSKV
jgi:hypothetical protein